VSMLSISPEEAEELYSVLKPLEERLPPRLLVVLTRVERSLYERLTVQEIEGLSRRFSGG
jgi:hypothetical protein